MALFFVSLVVITSQAQTQCTTSTTGSTVDNEYQDFKIETSLSTTSKSFIRFNTCFLEITFDTYLYLYNNERTTIIDQCDDYCNKQNIGCNKNGRASHETHDTIWDLNVNTLTDSEYILQLAGYNSEEGSFKLMLSYDCQHNINISAVYPETTTIINTVLMVPETTTTSTSIINSSFACDEEYTCAFIIKTAKFRHILFSTTQKGWQKKKRLAKKKKR
eukprot:425483_1